MRYEPGIDGERLLEAACDAYRLPMSALSFVPVGYAAACYVVGCDGENVYFLKLWPEARLGRPSIARLPLVRALHDRNLYRRVPVPLWTQNGALWSTFQGMPFALFPFLTDAPAPRWEEWPLAWRDEYARTLAAIHRATPFLADVLRPHERFEIPVEPVLLRAFDALERVGSEARPGLRALRHLLLSRREEIGAQLARLHALQETVRRLPDTSVLCHTDPGPENLLVSPDGQFTVLDWDEAMVAPPEHDLYEAARERGFERVLEVYREAGGVQTLYLEHFAFYLLRRYLNDLGARVTRILEMNATAEEDDYDLHGAEAWGFVQWRRLDQTLDTLAPVLH